ncbi:MAG: TonB-dependent receptor [Colwellia sp.]|nr:TonB-dependent receptor [Colwellia sp.]
MLFFARASVISLCLLPLFKANAEQAQPNYLETIEVTSAGRVKPLLNIAKSITVITGDEIADQGIDSLTQLSYHIPNFYLTDSGQSGLQAPSMRGLTAGIISFSTTVPIYLDGVPILSAQGFETALIDIEQVEVLRGPQGSLYGRNAQAGVISIRSRMPDDEASAKLRLSLAERNKYQLQGSIALPISDSFFLSLAVRTQDQQGFIDNSHQQKTENDRHQDALRLNLVVKPNNVTKVSWLSSYLGHDDGALSIGKIGVERYRVSSGEQGYNHSKTQSHALTVNHQFTDDISFSSVSSYRILQERIFQDLDLLPQNFVSFNKAHDFSRIAQEFTLDGSGQQHTWSAGFYADKDDNDLNFDRYSIQENWLTSHKAKAKTQALFSHWQFTLAKPLQLDMGLRYEQSQHSLQNNNNHYTQNADFSHWSPSLSLSYQVADTLYYASLSDGFRAGGFNPYSPPNLQAYQPESLYSLELGSKSSFFDNRLSLALALYAMDIDDMQVQQAIAATNQVYLSNAAKANSYGIELEYRAYLANWQIFGSVAVNRTRFTNFVDSQGDYQGNYNPYAPKYTGSINVRYQAETPWFIQAEANFIGDFYLDRANSYQRLAYQLFNMQLGYQFSQASISFYGNNLFDENYDLVGEFQGSRVIYSPPRELGLRLSYQF